MFVPRELPLLLFRGERERERKKKERSIWRFYSLLSLFKFISAANLFEEASGKPQKGDFIKFYFSVKYLFLSVSSKENQKRRKWGSFFFFIFLTFKYDDNLDIFDLVHIVPLFLWSKKILRVISFRYFFKFLDHLVVAHLYENFYLDQSSYTSIWNIIIIFKVYCLLWT